MSEADLIEHFAEFIPPGMDPAVWSELSQGDRLRRLREHHYLLALTAETRQAVLQLPRWVLYGPEHGFPETWFNADGFLLPKYREGGSHHLDFKLLLRWKRLHSYAMARSIERLDLRLEKHRLAFDLGSGFLGVLTYAVLLWLVSPDLPSHPLLNVLRISLVVFSYQLGKRFFQPAIMALILRCHSRRLAKIVLRRIQAFSHSLSEKVTSEAVSRSESFRAD